MGGSRVGGQGLDEGRLGLRRAGQAGKRAARDANPIQPTGDGGVVATQELGLPLLAQPEGFVGRQACPLAQVPRALGEARRDDPCEVVSLSDIKTPAS